MAKEICISSTPHETRLAILEDDQLTEIYYERENEYTLAGSIYKGRVTRVLPGMQSAFVELGLERDAFLYVTDFMEEQEDSADFEKVSTGSAGGASREAQPPREARAEREPGPDRESRPSRESRPNREPRSAREPRTDREPRQNREPREARAPQPTMVVQSESAGEGVETPHAGQKGEEFEQGTRRWRGRRGRRRGGRPQEPREGGASQAAEPTPSQAAPTEAEHDPSIYEETISPGMGQAVFSERVAPVAPPATSTGSQTIVLPGESLSRYGGKPAEAAPRQSGSAANGPAATVSTSSYRPSTLVEVVPGWDGGAELPGESLSRYRGKTASAPQPQPASEIVEHAWEVPSHAHASASREDLTEEPSQSAGESSAIEESPAGTQQEPDSESYVQRAEAHSGEATPEAATLLIEAQRIEEPSPSPEEQSPEEVHFEPENATASYRIDAAAPSEYRTASAFEEEAAVEVPELQSPASEASVFAHEQEDAAVEEEARLTGASQSSSEGSFHEGAHTPVAEGWYPHEAAAPEEVSAVVYEDEATPSAPVDASPEAADPLLEERAASPATAELPQGADTEFFDDSDEDEMANGPLGFAPGAGTLEEEIIEEEEYDAEPIHAYADENDLDDLEEETLDNLAGAELSEMVRDAHLEQRIGASPDGVVEDEEAEIEYGQAETEGDDEEEGDGVEGEQAATSSPAPTRGDGRPEDGRRGGGRGPRRRGRPNGGGSGGGGGSRRANSQLSDLPIISELLKQGQEILVQIAKEPIAKKGARITSHIALPGRFLVFMPTVNHVGVSRKISSDEERQRLKRILISEKGTASGGFIVRTAADGASEEDLRADIRFLISLWTDIKQRADDGKAPALIYHDLNLIERVLRDQVSANFSTIWVDNEAEYERIVRFLNRFEPSLVRRVKLYSKDTPLFEQFGIQEEISKALKSKVWLKSGGSIVINQTEALVAIDINTGKYVGKTARLEDTILKTNLDAIPEIVRQIRLRDLGGIIVIDFIDMDERKNRHKVMAALEEELKSDRAPSKVLQFNDFGLVAITRKRVKQSLERTLSVQCDICAGTGMVKSPTTVCNEIYTELRKMQKHLERGDVLLRVHPEVVKTLKSNNAKWLNELEEMTTKTIIVKSDPALHPEQFDIH